MKKLLFLFATFLLVISCEAVNNIKSKLGKKQVSVANTQWLLVNGNVGSSKTPTLILEKDKVSGNAGCNNYFGELSMEPNSGSISIKNLGATRMACDNMLVENNYLSMLEKVNKYIQDGENLELYKDNLLLLKFKKY